MRYLLTRSKSTLGTWKISKSRAINAVVGEAYAPKRRDSGGNVSTVGQSRGQTRRCHFQASVCGFNSRNANDIHTGHVPPWPRLSSDYIDLPPAPNSNARGGRQSTQVSILYTRSLAALTYQQRSCTWTKVHKHAETMGFFNGNEFNFFSKVYYT